MDISARILAHSRAPCGAEVATMEWIYNRSIHSEIMTHRGLSKNAASSRAIPIDKMLGRIEDDPFIPKVWGANKKGMQGGDELQGDDRKAAIMEWERARDSAVGHARVLQGMGLHKQIVNRVTEPWMYITIIVSATSWDNVWGLRCHPDAEPHFQELAKKARSALKESKPRILKAGEWHLPLISEREMDILQSVHQSCGCDGALDTGCWKCTPDKHERPVGTRLDELMKISIGRCARVSYLTHDGKRDLQADLDLYDRMAVQEPKHATPAEHVAQAMAFPSWYNEAESTWSAGRKGIDGAVYRLRDEVVKTRRARLKEKRPPNMREMMDETCLGEMTSGNYLGFTQFRKTVQNEHIGGLMP